MPFTPSRNPHLRNKFSENGMTTLTALVTLLPLKISVYWQGRTKTSLTTINKAIYIRANNPSLNRNVGKFHLPHIWDEVLLNISELKLK